MQLKSLFQEFGSAGGHGELAAFRAEFPCFCSAFEVEGAKPAGTRWKSDPSQPAGSQQGSGVPHTEGGGIAPWPGEGLLLLPPGSRSGSAAPPAALQ